MLCGSAGGWLATGTTAGRAAAGSAGERGYAAAPGAARSSEGVCQGLFAGISQILVVAHAGLEGAWQHCYMQVL